MITARRLIAVGLIAFLLFVLAQPPARLIAPALNSAGISPTNVTGTLWSGSLGRFAVAGVVIDTLDWKLKPAALLTGRVAASIDAESPMGLATADLSVSALGNITVRDADISLGLAPLGPMLRLDGLQGNARLSLSEVIVADGWPEDVAGNLELSALRFSPQGLPAPLQLGSYTAELGIAEGAADEPADLSAIINDAGGPLEVRGNWRLTPALRYNFNANVKARPDADPQLAQGLMLLGAPADDGSTSVTLSGSLN